MSGLSFFRRMSLHRLRKSSTSSHTDQPSPVDILAPVDDEPLSAPETQTVLLLHAAKQPYQLTDSYPVPQLQGDREVLVRVQAIGLNPIDWKAPDFNFALPELPYISGRELAGEVVQTSTRPSRLRSRDKVLVISTDYRDLRKAAYQEYVVAFDYNIVRLPPSLSVEEGSTLGVAFVAAALALGVCMGVDFSGALDGPDLFSLIRQVDPEAVASDIRSECLDGIQSHERAKAGDWLAIWGGSSTSANLTIQLARLVGIKTVVVVDKAKHGLRLANHTVLRPDLLVDSHSPERAVAIIRGNLPGQVRFGIDTRGRDTATSLLQALSPSNLASTLPTSSATTKPPTATTSDGSPPVTPPATPHASTLLSAHLIGLTGLPKPPPPEGTLFHTVPIKLFHELPAVGDALAAWLERLLIRGLVAPPEIIDVEHGLASVNGALDRMRKGEISGGKLVVKVAA
ncbi:chaperonin 10-like protein [Lasiosphaeria ovina]|uniref:Chaperonin 10-like protein n=1 Tax=Lasiosphaeria ovina TaxID=92902 RepID=A0AAE0NBA7_9PEZI|nr:chaperonin 10-like protein [Lasiosphaeria ovina]